MLSIRSLRVDRAASVGPITILDRIDLDVRSGEIVSLIGPSGCGKTTLLRCLAGLDAPSAGAISLRGEPVAAPRPGLAMVFQDYVNSLFPWRTALGNVLFAMTGGPLPRARREAAAMDWLERVGLAPFASYHPWELSGGMQQRLAMARALAGGAEILLMDEPFASLDSLTRAGLEDLLLDIWSGDGKTVIFVTHDLDEAIYLADRVVILGGVPTTVRSVIETGLPRPRDQLATRGDARFLALRRLVHAGLGQGEAA